MERVRANEFVLVNYIEQAWLPYSNGSLTAFSTMPFTITTTALLQSIFFTWLSFIRWGNATPLKRADDCPGYKASNVVWSDNSVIADLALAGTACNLYSPDLTDLKFLAEWQTGELMNH